MERTAHITAERNDFIRTVARKGNPLQPLRLGLKASYSKTKSQLIRVPLHSFALSFPVALSYPTSPTSFQRFLVSLTARFRFCFPSALVVTKNHDGRLEEGYKYCGDGRRRTGRTSHPARRHRGGWQVEDADAACEEVYGCKGHRVDVSTPFFSLLTSAFGNVWSVAKVEHVLSPMNATEWCLVVCSLSAFWLEGS